MPRKYDIMADIVNGFYVNEVVNGLTELACNVSARGKLNLTDIHHHAENFFAGLLNIIFNLKLHNANQEEPNVEGIDLIDEDAQIIIQVSSICTKHKIDHSLEELKGRYTGYRFRFLPIITGSAKAQVNNTYNVPEGIVFEPQRDILDIPTLSRVLTNDTTGKAEETYDYLKKNLTSAFSVGARLTSGLEYVIKELAKDGIKDDDFDATDFGIEAKVAFNNLDYGKSIVNEYASQYNKVSRIYEEYSKLGQYKSKAVLQKLHNIYLRNKNNCSGDELFMRMEKEIGSSVDVKNMPDNFTQEELDMFVDILMVHAFMECQIFEKPV